MTRMKDCEDCRAVELVAAALCKVDGVFTWDVLSKARAPVFRERASLYRKQARAAIKAVRRVWDRAEHY